MKVYAARSRLVHTNDLLAEDKSRMGDHFDMFLLPFDVPFPVF